MSAALRLPPVKSIVAGPPQLQRFPAQIASRQSFAPRKSAVSKKTWLDSFISYRCPANGEVVLVDGSRIKVRVVEAEALQFEILDYFPEPLVLRVEVQLVCVPHPFGESATALLAEALSIAGLFCKPESGCKLLAEKRRIWIQIILYLLVHFGQKLRRQTVKSAVEIQHGGICAVVRGGII